MQRLSRALERRREGDERREGKIPRLSNWADALANRVIGLDSLMNLAGLNTFISDQKEMDDHVREVLKRAGVRR